MIFTKALSVLIFALPLGLVNALRTKRATCPDGVHTVTNTQCCFLFPIVQDLVTNMMGGDCGDEAHTALRMMFHDAIGISPTAGGGGADGSILVFNATELTFAANAGIDDAIAVAQPFLNKYVATGILTPGDFVQLAGTVSLTNCAGAPRVKFSLGRPPPVAASPPNLIPNPFDTVQTILARFNEVGFSPAEVVALIASHSVAGADHVDPSIPGTPFDSTPSVFDTQLFVEVQLRGTVFPGATDHQGEVQAAVKGEMRLQSDHLLARDPATNCAWQSFVNNQAHLQSAFAAALFKMTLLGQNPAKMIDCSEVIPQPLPLNVQATFPPGLSNTNVEQACATSSFPVLSTQPGQPTAIPPIPQS